MIVFSFVCILLTLYLLQDFRNFQYTLSVVKDLVIHVEEKKRVSLQIPKLSYEKVCKVLSISNEQL